MVSNENLPSALVICLVRPMTVEISCGENPVLLSPWSLRMVLVVRICIIICSVLSSV